MKEAKCMKKLTIGCILWSHDPINRNYKEKSQNFIADQLDLCKKGTTSK